MVQRTLNFRLNNPYKHFSVESENLLKKLYVKKEILAKYYNYCV